jgi:hypothetical protein
MPRYIGPSCIDCGVSSPVTNTSYTRVSLAGWRSIRKRRTVTVGLLGRRFDHWTIQWRCPVCWGAYRASGQLAITLPEITPASPAPGL